MKSKRYLAGVALVALMSGSVMAAQERLEAAAREVAELSMAAGDHARCVMRIMRRGGDGPMLGINIDSGEAHDGNTRDGHTREGVRIISVSPGGPGAAAGLKAGDVITSFNSKALKSTGEQSAADQLVAAIGASKIGESVPIEYQRDGNTIKTTVKPAQLPPEIRGRLHIEVQPDMPDRAELNELRDLHGSLPGRMFAMGVHDRAGFGSAELVELTVVMPGRDDKD